MYVTMTKDASSLGHSAGSSRPVQGPVHALTKSSYQNITSASETMLCCSVFLQRQPYFLPYYRFC